MRQAVENKYTDVIVINEDNRVPNGLLLSHLPDGPTAHFKLSNVKISKEIRRDYREITAHRPEVILNNFTTRLGHTVARMMACLFHYDPEFRGKRAVTFHNQALIYLQFSSNISATRLSNFCNALASGLDSKEGRETLPSLVHLVVHLEVPPLGVVSMAGLHPNVSRDRERVANDPLTSLKQNPFN